MSIGNTVSCAAAQDLVDICLELDILSTKTLTELGWDRSWSNSPDSRLPESVLISLWQEIDKHDKGRCLGLRIGQTINPNAKGLLASWVSQCSNLGEALEVFTNNLVLMNASENITVHRQDSLVSLTFNIGSKQQYPTIAIERSMSAVMAWAYSLTGNELTIEKAEFSFPEPDYAHQFKQIFGHSIRFNASSNRISIKAQALELPIVSSNSLVKGIIQSKASELLSDIQGTSSTQEKVKKRIEERIKSSEPVSAELISASLGMSRQTLYRKLKEESSDFKTLFDQIRKEEAAKQLDRGVSLSSLSLHLGFKETSGFYKAYKRWFGHSPKAVSRDQTKN